MSGSPAPRVLDPGPWKDLNDEERSFLASTAREIVRRESPNLKVRYGGNVEGIGHGLVARGPGRKVDRLVIRFFVHSRRGPATLRRLGEDPLPPYLSKRTTWNGRGVEVRLPTDVEELRYGRPQIGPIQVDRSGSRLRRGSTCCVTREVGSQDRFLLSCYHVAAGCGLCANCAWDCDRSDGMKRYAKGSNGWIPLSVQRQADLPELSKGIDAACMTIPSGVHVDPRVAGLQLTGRMTNANRIPLGAKLVLATRRGRVNGTFRGITGPIRLAYTCNGRRKRFTFRNLLEVVASPPTKLGDSGAAVVWGSTLLGMHFYLTKRGRSLAIPANELFAKATFGRSLELL